MQWSRWACIHPATPFGGWQSSPPSPFLGKMPAIVGCPPELGVPTALLPCSDPWPGLTVCVCEVDPSQRAILVTPVPPMIPRVQDPSCSEVKRPPLDPEEVESCPTHTTSSQNSCDPGLRGCHSWKCLLANPGLENAAPNYAAVDEPRDMLLQSLHFVDGANANNIHLVLNVRAVEN